MSEMSAIYRAWEADKRDRRHRNLEEALNNRDDQWTIHTEHHWSRDLCGERMDFWPSSNKFKWQGISRFGNIYAVMNFIHNREQDCG